MTPPGVPVLGPVPFIWAEIPLGSEVQAPTWHLSLAPHGVLALVTFDGPIGRWKFGLFGLMSSVCCDSLNAAQLACMMKLQQVAQLVAGIATGVSVATVTESDAN